MTTGAENQIRALVQESGNSDVDVNVYVDIDTKSIAYAILCAMYAKGELSEIALEKAIKKLNQYLNRNQKDTKTAKNACNVKPFSNCFKENNRRKPWI